MNKFFFIPAFLLLAVFAGGCSDQHYSGVKTGKLQGSLIVEWVNYDEFRYIPHPERPLTFTRYNNEVIKPEAMVTDGGSIPRVFRFMKNYSPWGYGPAFIVHDWLFVMHHCKIQGHDKYDLDTSATVMSEVMKTMMEDPKFGGKDALVLYSMYEAVKSDAAKKYFEDGKCDREADIRTFQQKAVKPPIARYEISFD